MPKLRRVWIDYDPPLGPARCLSELGAQYARWYVRQMVGGAAGATLVTDPAGRRQRPGP
jgi:hypothetical protein